MNRKIIQIVFFSTVIRAFFGEEGHFHDDGRLHDSEAFLGQEEAAKHKKLSVEQSKERLKKLLAKIDTDKNGLISEDEMAAQIETMTLKYLLEHSDEQWKKCGTEATNSGKLSWEDYRKAWMPVREEKDVTAEYEQLVKERECKWKKADKDGDNKLDRDEFICFTHPMHCRESISCIVMEKLHELDTNKDGSIDVEEYIREGLTNKLTEEEIKQRGKERAEAFKTFYDKDGDGKLSEREISNWILPDNYKHARSEARHLMWAADKDKDVQLSQDEVFDQYELFVGGRITNYGEAVGLKRDEL